MKDLEKWIECILTAMLVTVIVSSFFYDSYKFNLHYQKEKTLCEKDLPRSQYCSMIVLPTNEIDQLKGEENE